MFFFFLSFFLSLFPFFFLNCICLCVCLWFVAGFNCEVLVACKSHRIACTDAVLFFFPFLSLFFFFCGRDHRHTIRKAAAVMIILERAPMTNGEVFALLRRRRDERNAKAQPPFGMQFVGSSNMSQMQQQRVSASMAANASAHTSLFFPPEALVSDAQFFVVNGTISATPRPNANNHLLFSSPAASHLMVLLTEVRALRYLSRYATISGRNSMHALYGPTSVHTRRYQELGAFGSDEDVRRVQRQSEEKSFDALSPQADEAFREISAATKTQEQALTQLVRRYRPGTVGHVRAVLALLGLWETNGREMERQGSTRVKSVLRAVRQRLNESARGNEENSIPHNNDKDNQNREQQQQHSSSEQLRPLFTPPSLPLAVFLAEQPPVVTAAVMTTENHQWTEQDVIRLVMARPQSSLDVHRVVENIEEIVGHNEELLNFIEEELLKVFL
ncbi:hypothetical protein MOQ_003263 [Trypanosoma cruzi marinkellei]|uniref:Uncharacterized protein n=1 Tax=Trypanosoma cruzi marinkellei TaxID=85056 RepID=K2MCE3_TRYCR|nr:hypothetical protein MOQ_003263 [Trypanosoma cruzi marinkellei]